MYLIGVKFLDTEKIYYYKTKLNLIKGATYDIIADGKTSYSTPIKIYSISSYSKNSDFAKTTTLREITEAILKQATARPDVGIKDIYINKEKRTTCIKWKDDTLTKVKCDISEEFDVEKGIAMCFMKKAFNNRGCFNEIFKKYKN